MKIFSIALFFLLAMTGTAMANDGPVQEGFMPSHFPSDLISIAAFCSLAILILLAAYKLFDRFTPGCRKFEEEVQKGNIAAAIVMAAAIIGLCYMIGSITKAIVD